MVTVADLMEERDEDVAFNIFEDFTVYRDNQRAYFGTDGDAWIDYNSTLDALEIGGKGLYFDGGLSRKVTTKAIDATLVKAEIMHGLVEVTVAAKTMTLPAASSTLKGADVIISPKGAISTTVALASGTVGNDGATSTVSVGPGSSAHLICDGSTWYQDGGGGGAGSLTYVDYVEIATPADPAANTLRLFGADSNSSITVLKAKFAGGTVKTIGFEMEVDVSRHAGATLGDKIASALAANPSASVLNAESVTGNLTMNGVVLHQKVHLKLPAGDIPITSGTGVQLHLDDADGELEGATGAMIDGQGPYVTRLLCEGGTTGIHIESLYNKVSNLSIHFQDDDDANVGILLFWNGVIAVEMPQIENVQIIGGQIFTGKGKGMFFKGPVFCGSVKDCQVREFEDGIKSEAEIVGGVNAVTFISNRIFGNKYGWRGDFGYVTLVNNTTEGNSVAGAYLDNVFVMTFTNNAWEQHDCPNIVVVGTQDNFVRTLTFEGEQFLYSPDTATPQGDLQITDEGGSTGVEVYINGGYAFQGFAAPRGRIIVDNVKNVPPDYSISGNVIVHSWDHIQGYAGTNYQFYGFDNYFMDSNFIVNSSSTSTVAFTVRGDDDGLLIATDPSRNAAGIGIYPNLHMKLSIGNTENPSSGIAQVGFLRGDWNPDALATSFYVGFSATSQTHFNVDPDDDQDFTNGLIGGGFSADHRGTGTVSVLSALQAGCTNYGEGHVESARTLDIFTSQLSSGGLIDEAIGIRIWPPTITDGDITGYASLEILSPGSAGATFASSIYVTGGDCIFNGFKVDGGLFIVKGNNDVDPFYTFQIDQTDGTVTIGYPDASFGKFMVYQSDTLATGNRISSYSTYAVAPTVNSNGSYASLMGDIASVVAHDFAGGMTGVRGEATWASSGTNTMALLTGGSFLAFLGGHGDATFASGITTGIRHSGDGEMTASAGIEILAPTNSGGGDYLAYWALRALASPFGGYGVAVQGGSYYYNGFGTLFPSAVVEINQAAEDAGFSFQPPCALRIVGGAHTNNPTGIETPDVHIDLDRTVTWATGGINWQRSILIEPETIAFNGDSTVNVAATLAITGPPAAGAHATLSESYALWLQDGGARIEGGIQVYEGDADYGIVIWGPTSGNLGEYPIHVAGGHSLFRGGIMHRERLLESGSAPETPTFQSGSTYTNLAGNTGATTDIALPAIGSDPSSFFTWVVVHADGFKITANGTDKIRMVGTLSAAGGYIKSVVVGSVVRLLATSGGIWIGEFITGTWTVDS